MGGAAGLCAEFGSDVLDGVALAHLGEIIVDVWGVVLRGGDGGVMVGLERIERPDNRRS